MKPNERPAMGDVFQFLQTTLSLFQCESILLLSTECCEVLWKSGREGERVTRRDSGHSETIERGHPVFLCGIAGSVWAQQDVSEPNPDLYENGCLV